MESMWSSLFQSIDMLRHWRARLNERKFRLFLAASARRKFPDRPELAGTVEQFADGLCTQAEYGAAWTEISSLCAAAQKGPANPMPPHGYFLMQPAAIDILGDVLGNPFRPVQIERGWLGWNDRTPERIARRIYEERRFEDLPILADALEEAGCTLPEMLEHCRQPRTHYRGCWLIDMILNRE